MIIGIDLGTTYSRVAMVKDSTVQLIENGNGDSATPSIVAFTEDNEVLVGTLAKRQSRGNPKSAVGAVKRLIEGVRHERKQGKSPGRGASSCQGKAG